MVIGIADLYHHQSQWAEPLDNAKLGCSTSIQELYPCRYNEDLGSDDSEPESQASESSISQDSGHSPATSYSSEESRADTNQRANDALYDTWSTAQVPGKNPSGSRITCQVPFRPKSDLNSHQKASEHALLASQRAAQQQTVHNDLRDVPTSKLQNPRRGRPTGATLPPALRRDTDPTDNIVRMIVLFCTNLINSIWCTSGQSPIATGASQQGGNVLPLEVFITETLRRSKTSYSTLQIALYYLILLKQCLPAQTAADRSGCRAMRCGRRMFLTSLILASKYLQDRNYSARAWSKISGLPLKEINENERRFLSIVSWDLHVPKSTFENWSKIVLQVCRRSQDASSGCKGSDEFLNGPRSGPGGALQHLALPMNGNNWTWWLINLRQLRTDVVKCGIKTQRYVESLCPFKQMTPIIRSISPESDISDDAIDSLADILVETPTGSRQPSLDRSSKRFEPVPDLLHPAAPLAMPSQPMLRNLPTPLTTPQSNIQNYWTPRLAHQSSTSSLRCRASASALGSAFRKHCPIANLETCPPPPPRTCDRGQRSCLPVDNTYTTSASVVSSPESTLSETFSVTGRSRSSSISSTASWSTSSSHNSDLRWFVGNQPAALSAACPKQPSTSGYAPKDEQAIERPRTAFKVPQVSEAGYEPTPWCGNDEPLTTWSSYEEACDDTVSRRQREADKILAGLQVDESVVRSRARPALSRSGTQIYNPRQEQDPKTQQLKRSRSDTFEFPSSSLCPLQTIQTTLPTQNTASYFQQGLDSSNALNNCNLSVQQPTQYWAQPRKPLQTGPQNKRLALQISPPESLAAAELASRYLKSDQLRIE